MGENLCITTNQKDQSQAQNQRGNNMKDKPVKLPQTNQQGKKVGSDNKACWPGYRYSGTVKGRDICTPVKKK